MHYHFLTHFSWKQAKTRQHAWTMEHAFFAIMGGFQLDCPAPCTQLGFPQSSLMFQAGGVVTPRGFKIILGHEANIIPDVSIGLNNLTSSSSVSSGTEKRPVCTITCFSTKAPLGRVGTPMKSVGALPCYKFHQTQTNINPLLERHLHVPNP